MIRISRLWLAFSLAVVLLVLAACYPPVFGTPTPRPSPTPEPLIPTVPADRVTPAVTATRDPLATPAATQPAVAPSTVTLPASQKPPAPFAFGASPRSRVCVAVPGSTTRLADFDWAGAEPGWWLNWNVLASPASEQPFAQMVRTYRGALNPDPATIAAAARANPGSLWLIGNEMDVAWQDNATPEQYVGAYHVAYEVIKTADPTAQVAIGGVSQPTPMRLAYLDRILELYRQQYGGEMPVDVWNVHAFVLREERDSWGVGIPPGTAADKGLLREIEDHADLALFQEQMVAFRKWMAEGGQRDKPLIVSEYGILMPADYGFPPERVAAFLKATFDYFLAATDAHTGYSADGDRLVQAFCWYSAADDVYATSSLFDFHTGVITGVGEGYRAYVSALPD